MVRLIADCQPRPIFILEEDGRYWFANEEASRQAGRDPMALVGEPLEKYPGIQPARKVLARAREALAARSPVISMDQVGTPISQRYVQTYHIPLRPTGVLKNAVLVMENDITEVVTERGRNERMLRSVLDALVAVVDRRDPHASGHSFRVGQLARAIAEEMGIDSILFVNSEQLKKELAKRHIFPSPERI